MVNASLNWASIVGIVLAVCGAGLYFMRSFKPALARDYDVFFAAIGLLCGGILFFQGWRLDPILQFGQFLLAGTTVFFGYESVRLRGVATDQARKSSYFDDDPPSQRMQGRRSSNEWDDNYEQFEDANSPSRRFSGQQEFSEEDLYRPRRTSRAAIPEQAESRRTRRNEDSWGSSSERSRRFSRFREQDDDLNRKQTRFGDRRNLRQEQRRGSRPLQNQGPRTTQRPLNGDIKRASSRKDVSSPGVPQGAPIRNEAEDAAFSPSSGRPINTEGRRPSRSSRSNRPQESTSSSRRPSPNRPKPRDNNSRFDD